MSPPETPTHTAGGTDDTILSDKQYVIRWWIIGHMDGKSGVSSFVTPRSPLSTTDPKNLVHVVNQELVGL